jgi:hypothetical protein
VTIGPAVALEHHQPFGLQTLERLAHRDLADIELPRDVVLANGLVFGELPGDDRVAQVPGDDLGGRRRVAEVRCIESG